MNKCIIQFWEESERGWGIRPDGCSLHLNQSLLDQFIQNHYSDRDPNHVPDEYDRTSGSPFECFVSDILYNKMKNTGSIRLWENEKNNLKKEGDITFKPE